MRQSGIATYYVSSLPPDDVGLVRVTSLEFPLPAGGEHAEERHVYEIQPGMSVDDLPGTPATITIIGSPWTIDALAESHPEAVPYVLNGEWEEEVPDPDNEGETIVIFRRDRMISAPEGTTFRRQNLPPHRWFGDN